jgi:HEAT repeat protein
MLAVRELPASAESVAELLAATEDSSPDIAREALRRLSQTGDPQAAVRLRSRMLEVDPALIVDFAKALAALGDREAASLAARALVAGKPHRRIAAASALEVLAGSEEIPALLSALRDPLAGVRSRCLRRLARIGADVDVPACASLLRDPDASVRTAAVEAVAALAPDAARRLEPLCEDRAPAVRQALARRLGLLSESAAERLLEDRHHVVREAAIAVAGPSHAPTLIELLETDPVAEVRMAAARRLAAMGVEEGSAALVDSLADPSPIVRAATLAAMREAVGRDATVELLLDALEDADARMRKALAYSLARLKATKTEWAFTALAKDSDRDVRIAAAHCGARLFGCGWPPLGALLEDPDPAVAHAAEVALAEQATRGCLPSP